MTVNKVILVGNLGRDPEMRYTNNQLPIAKFSLATNERRKDSEGNWGDHTEWHRIVAFGKLGEFCGNYLGKGKSVYVEGRLSTSKWQDKEGNNRYTTEVIAENIRFVGNKNADNTSYSNGPSPEQTSQAFESLKPADSLGSAKQSQEPATFDDDDIPF